MMNEVIIDQHTPSKPLRRQRLRVSNACQVCRLRKIKCDGARPGISFFHCFVYLQSSCIRLTQTVKNAPDARREVRHVFMAILSVPLRSRQRVNPVDKHHQFTSLFLSWPLRHPHSRVHQHQCPERSPWLIQHPGLTMWTMIERESLTWSKTGHTVPHMGGLPARLPLP